MYSGNHEADQYEAKLEAGDNCADVAAAKWRDDCDISMFRQEVIDSDAIFDQLNDLFNCESPADWATCALKIRKQLHHLADDKAKEKLIAGDFDGGLHD